MARLFVTSINLNKNELQNARIQNLSSNPSSPVAGQIYFNTTDKELRTYDGTQWVGSGTILYGNTASRPTASKAGLVYADTTTGTFYLDNGTSWLQIGANAKDITDAINALNTDDIEEGLTNKYYTSERAKQEAAELLVNSTQTNISITKDGNNDLTITAENGVADSTTDDLDEGINNLYFTEERAQDAVGNSVGTGLTYTDSTGEIKVTPNTYDNYGSAATAESNAKTYADGLAGNYDPAGSAATAQSNAEIFATGEVSDHNALTTGVHGVTGDIVGTTDIQNLSNKTFLGTITLKSAGGAGGTSNTIDVDNSTGVVTLSSGYGININATGDIILSPTGGAYVGSAIAANEIVTQADIQALSSGLNWKAAVNLRVASNIDLTQDFVGVVIDGHDALDITDVGYRILVTGQSTDTENGIYELYADSTLLKARRPQDAAIYSELVGAAVFVMEGTQFGATSWVQTNHYITSFAGQIWSQFSGQGTYTGSDSIYLDGTSFSVIADATRGLGLDVDGVFAKLGNGVQFDGNGDIEVLAGTGFDTSTGTLQFAAGYGLRKISTTMGNNADTSFNIDHNFQTRQVTVQVFQASSPYAMVEADIERPTIDRVVVKFATAPAVGEYEVVVIG